MEKTTNFRTTLTIIGTAISASCAIIASLSNSDSHVSFGLLEIIYVFGLLIIVAAGIHRPITLASVFFRIVIVGMVGLLGALGVFTYIFS